MPDNDKSDSGDAGQALHSHYPRQGQKPGRQAAEAERKDQLVGASKDEVLAFCATTRTTAEPVRCVCC